MKLHYSQTTWVSKPSSGSFSTLWNYTTLKQFECAALPFFRFSTLWNYTTLKRNMMKSLFFTVSVPYEITLLSNFSSARQGDWHVSVPYEITLLSNSFSFFLVLWSVSVPYEITLLSNTFVMIFCTLFVSVPYEITLLSNIECAALPCV